MKRFASADAFFEDATIWRQELLGLRKVLLTKGLHETIKWGSPCYTCNGKNIVGIGAFKSYFGLWFFQGALLSDPQGVLINAQQGKTKSLRQWRMHSKKDIRPSVIRAYIQEAIDLQKAGLQIAPRRANSKTVAVPQELRSALAADKQAADGFNALTIGKQREYAEYIAEAKRVETKLKRLEKVLPLLVAGKGLNDKYRNC